MDSPWLSMIWNEQWKSKEEEGMETWRESPKETEDHQLDLKISFKKNENINNRKNEMELEAYLNKHWVTCWEIHPLVQQVT